MRKGNPLTLLVGVQTSTATTENSVEIPQKTKIELPWDPAILVLGLYLDKSVTGKDTRNSSYSQ